MMVDEAFEQYLREHFISRDEFEQRWREKANDLHIFVDSHDRYLRLKEDKIDQLTQKLEIETAKIATASEAFSQIMRYQADVNEQQQERANKQDERISSNEQALARLEKDVTGIYDGLYGNAAHPDAPISIAGMIRSGFANAEEQRLGLLREVTETRQELSEVKAKVDRWQGVITMFQTQSKAFMNTALGAALRTVVGKIVFGGLAVYAAARAAYPETMDRIGAIIAELLSTK